ncbi:uncharacterized protein BDW47DRAFT_102746 [Aspergillus candidus]|uniref:Uncharacterized protein n=1 Tax=Aspergillus candidus TaxID=41067 RepID=A0A2I2FG23_ASPCN|nr:hypothetical protein BDW47DRAFT_102746 [Aspergillus candidus]PLB39583.1 hypothetical protein BDW47DRAFT_102746 [Aspergillus candidus]
MPTINIINDSDHLSFVSSVPSFTPHSHPPRLRHSPSIANLSRWVVNRLSRRSLREEYTGSDRPDLSHFDHLNDNNDTNHDNNPQANPHHGYNRRRRPHRALALKEETNEDNDPHDNGEDEESEAEDSDEERLKEEYAAYCRAFTGSGCPDHRSPPRARWTMEASHHPGIVSGSSSPVLSPAPAPAATAERGEEEYGVPSPYLDNLDESHPQLQPPPRILTPALYVQTQAQAQQRKHPTEDPPVRPWWSTAGRWVCARP